jgi:uncharacterized protein
MDAVVAPHWPWLFINGTGHSLHRNGEKADEVMMTVTSQGGSAEDASALNEKLRKQVVNVIRSSAGPDVQITEAPWQLVPPRTTGTGLSLSRSFIYTATSELSIDFDDPDRAGAVIDTAARAGADQILSVTFDVRDPGTARAEAIRLATREAEQGAQYEASALHLKLGRLLESDVAQSSARSPADWVQGAADNAQPEVAIVFRHGMATVSAHVTLKYQVQ